MVPKKTFVCIEINECIPSPECIEYMTLRLNALLMCIGCTGNDFVITLSILTLFESGSKECFTPVLSGPIWSKVTVTFSPVEFFLA